MYLISVYLKLKRIHTFVVVFTQYVMILAFGKNPATISPFLINDREVEVVTFFRSGGYG